MIAEQRLPTNDALEIVTPPTETDVVIPAESLERLHLKIETVTEKTISAEIRVPGQGEIVDRGGDVATGDQGLRGIGGQNSAAGEETENVTPGSDIGTCSNTAAQHVLRVGKQRH